jgi:HprK-related kinase A
MLEASPTRTIEELGAAGFRARLRDNTLGVRLGPFDVALGSDVAAIDEPLFRLYRDYPALDGPRVFHAHARLRANGKRVRLLVDGRAPHEDLPIDQALAVLEWGLNIVIALRSHSLLLLHSAVVERGSGVLLLPAWPGSGKTTLSAALAHRGWRLFSDEFGLVRPASAEVLPIPRPMPLKNESIAVLRAFAPEAELGPTIPNTRKGTIAHLKPPKPSIREANTSGRVRWIVFPRWSPNEPATFALVPKAEAFMTLATNAFNYEMLGEAAFSVVRELVSSAACYWLIYSDLDRAIEQLNDLAARDGC